MLAGAGPPGDAMDEPSYRRPAAIRKTRLPAGRSIADRELAELTCGVHALGPRPLFELLVEFDAGGPLFPTVRRYADLLLQAGFITRIGGRDSP
jgi:hypothetical protein